MYNLANVQENRQETSVAQAIVIDDAEHTPMETTTIMQAPPNLVDKAAKLVHMVLNRAREEDAAPSSGATASAGVGAGEEEIVCRLPNATLPQVDQIEHECVHESEIKPSSSVQVTSRPIALNAPRVDTAYVDEQQVDDMDDDRHERDEDIDLVVPNVRVEKEADLGKPVLKKPMLLNTAKLSEG